MSDDKQATIVQLELVKQELYYKENDDQFNVLSNSLTKMMPKISPVDSFDSEAIEIILEHIETFKIIKENINISYQRIVKPTTAQQGIYNDATSVLDKVIDSHDKYTKIINQVTNELLLTLPSKRNNVKKSDELEKNNFLMSNIENNLRDKGRAVEAAVVAEFSTGFAKSSAPEVLVPLLLNKFKFLYPFKGLLISQRSNNQITIYGSSEQDKLTINFNKLLEMAKLLTIKYEKLNESDKEKHKKDYIEAQEFLKQVFPELQPIDTSCKPTDCSKGGKLDMASYNLQQSREHTPELVSDIIGASSLNIYGLKDSTFDDYQQYLSYLKTYLNQYPVQGFAANLLDFPLEIIKQLKEKDVSELIVNKLKSLKNGEVVIIPGGVSSKQKGTISVESIGHAIYYIIKKNTDNDFSFTVVDAAGVEQGLDGSKEKESDQDTPGKKFISPSKTWENINGNTLTAEFFKSLMRPFIDPLQDATYEWQRKPYQVDDIYTTLNNKLGVTRVVSNDLVTPQRNKRYNWSSLKMVVRSILGETNYKKFNIDFKYKCLQQLVLDLEDSTNTKYQDPRIRLLMLDQLKTGAAKLAKTIKKRANSLYNNQEVNEYKKEIKILLDREKELRKKYLNKYPGKLTDSNLNNCPTEATSYYDQASAINKKLSSLDGRAKSIEEPEQKLIKKDIPDASIGTGYSNNWFNKLKACTEHANKIQDDPKALRAFLTNNVFNTFSEDQVKTLQHPKPTVTYTLGFITSEEKDPNNYNLMCLEQLELLFNLYISTIQDGDPPLPEHKLNLVKIMQIGKSLINKQHPNLPFSWKLPKTFDDVFEEQITKSLDPDSYKQWDQCKIKCEGKRFSIEENTYDLFWREYLNDNLYFNNYFILYKSINNTPNLQLNELTKRQITEICQLMDSNQQDATTNSYDSYKSFRIMQKFDAAAKWFSGNDKCQKTDIKHEYVEYEYDGTLKYYWKLQFTPNSLKHSSKNLWNQEITFKDPDILSSGKKPSSQAELIKQQLEFNPDYQDYTKQQIIHAPITSKNTQELQLTLLLNWFENLPENNKDISRDVKFFQKTIFYNIDPTIEQLKKHTLVAARLHSFFDVEFAKLDQASLDSITDLKDLENRINRYVILQRTAHKLYAHLDSASKYDLTTSRARSQELLLQTSHNVDKGKVAAYALASFNHGELNDPDLLQQAMFFSTQVGIYGLGADRNSEDLLLEKDIYEVRFKIAKKLISLEENQRKNLLAYCLQNSGISELAIINGQELTWQQSDPYYWVNINGNIIKFNVWNGNILVNDVQVVVSNIPDKFSGAAAYQNVFGDHKIQVKLVDNKYTPVNNDQLTDFTIKEDPGNNKDLNVFWNQGGEQYVLLQDVSNLPPSLVFCKTDLNFWAKVTDKKDERIILVSPKFPGQAPKPFLQISHDGKITKVDNKELYLIENIGYRQHFSKLGIDVNNVLIWGNKDKSKSIVEIPLGDDQNDWLNFEKDLKKYGDNNLHWIKDPNYYIAPKQELNQRPSISNFILLRNKEGKQKALFANIKKEEHIGKQESLLETYPDVEGKAKFKYLEVDVEQAENTPAKLIGKDPLSNLYLAYLHLMQLEDEKHLASELLYRECQVNRRYTEEELKLLNNIIFSKTEQEKLKIPSLNPDAAVARLLARYLIKTNSEKYPPSSIDLGVFDQQTLKEYEALLQLPKPSARGRLRKFFSPQELERLLPKEKIKGLSESPVRKIVYEKSYYPRITENNFQESDQHATEDQLAKHRKLLEEQEQNIIKNLNDNVSELGQYSGHQRTLTIDDAIFLYLKQDLTLWEEYTGLKDTDLATIIRIQEQIINYLILKIRINHIQNYQKATDQATKDLLINTAKRDYSPLKYPAFLVYEALEGKMLKQEQVEAFKRLVSEQDNTHQPQQLTIMMGMGKSKVLSPLLAHTKADGQHLSILVLTDPLYTSGSSDLQSSLKLLNTRVQTIEFSREACTLDNLQKLQSQINNAIANGIACTARVKDLQMIDTMVDVLLEELSITEQADKTVEITAKLEILVNINDIIKTQGLFTLDEIDTQLNAKHQLNLPIGAGTEISAVGTKVASDLFLMLLEDDVSTSDLPIKQWLLTNEQAHLSLDDFEKVIRPKLIEKLFEKFNISSDLKASFTAYMSGQCSETGEPSGSAKMFFNQLQTWYDNKQPGEMRLARELSMYRMQLVEGVLLETLRKTAKVNFGRSKLQNDLEIVIPYSASDSPKELSKTACSFFKDPWETVDKTLLYYISTPWQDAQQNKKFIEFLRNILINNHPPEVVKKIEQIFSDEEINKLKIPGNSWDKENFLLTMQSKIEAERGKGNKDLMALLFEYFNKIIFPDLDQIKIHTVQATSNPQDFAAQPKVLNGYSGTTFGEKTWHSRIKKDEEQKYETEIFAKLTDPGSGNQLKIISNPDNQLDKLLNTLFFDTNKNQQNAYSSLIDAGALLKGFSNREIARSLLNVLPDTKTAVAFYEESSPGNIKLYLLVRDKDKPIAIEGSNPTQIAAALQCKVADLDSKLFNFYDQSHIIGSDLPNPVDGRALITFNEHLGKDLMSQSIMRMRKFTTTQHVDFAISEDTKKVISKSLKLNADSDLTLEHLKTNAFLVQENQEKDYYYSALHQKIDHEIKSYLNSVIRGMINNGQVGLAQQIFQETKKFILSFGSNDLFEQYGKPTGEKNPRQVLNDKLDELKSKINLLPDNIKSHIDIGDLYEKLNKILPADGAHYTNFLPEKVSANHAAIGVDMDLEKQQEQEVQQEQEMEEQHKFEGLNPSNNKDILGMVPSGSRVDNYLQKLILGPHQNGLQAIQDVLQEKISIDPKNQEWSSYNLILGEDQIYYSADMLQVFDGVQPKDSVLTVQEKPINQVLIVKEQDNSFKMVTLSAQECANFAYTLAAARENNYDSNNRQLWLVNADGVAVDGTSEWKNPFQTIQANPDAKTFRSLLLKSLVLQRNIDGLNKLADTIEQYPIFGKEFVKWFNDNQGSLEKIFGKKKSKQSFDLLKTKIKLAEEKLYPTKVTYTKELWAHLLKDVAAMQQKAEYSAKKFVLDKLKITETALNEEIKTNPDKIFATIKNLQTFINNREYSKLGLAPEQSSNTDFLNKYIERMELYIQEIDGKINTLALAEQIAIKNFEAINSSAKEGKSKTQVLDSLIDLLSMQVKENAIINTYNDGLTNELLKITLDMFSKRTDFVEQYSNTYSVLLRTQISTDIKDLVPEAVTKFFAQFGFPEITKQLVESGFDGKISKIIGQFDQNAPDSLSIEQTTTIAGIEFDFKGKDSGFKYFFQNDEKVKLEFKQEFFTVVSDCYQRYNEFINKDPRRSIEQYTAEINKSIKPVDAPYKKLLEIKRNYLEAKDEAEKFAVKVDNEIKAINELKTTKDVDIRTTDGWSYYSVLNELKQESNKLSKKYINYAALFTKEITRLEVAIGDRKKAIRMSNDAALQQANSDAERNFDDLLSGLNSENNLLIKFITVTSYANKVKDLKFTIDGKTEDFIEQYKFKTEQTFDIWLTNFLTTENIEDIANAAAEKLFNAKDDYQQVNTKLSHIEYKQGWRDPQLQIILDLNKALNVEYKTNISYHDIIKLNDFDNLFKNRYKDLLEKHKRSLILQEFKTRIGLSSDAKDADMPIKAANWYANFVVNSYGSSVDSSVKDFGYFTKLQGDLTKLDKKNYINIFLNFLQQLDANEKIKLLLEKTFLEKKTIDKELLPAAFGMNYATQLKEKLIKAYNAQVADFNGKIGGLTTSIATADKKTITEIKETINTIKANRKYLLETAGLSDEQKKLLEPMPDFSSITEAVNDRIVELFDELNDVTQDSLNAHKDLLCDGENQKTSENQLHTIFNKAGAISKVVNSLTEKVKELNGITNDADILDVEVENIKRNYSLDVLVLMDANKYKDVSNDDALVPLGVLDQKLLNNKAYQDARKKFDTAVKRIQTKIDDIKQRKTAAINNFNTKVASLKKHIESNQIDTTKAIEEIIDQINQGLIQEKNTINEMLGVVTESLTDLTEVADALIVKFNNIADKVTDDSNLNYIKTSADEAAITKTEEQLKELQGCREKLKLLAEPGRSINSLDLMQPALDEGNIRIQKNKQEKATEHQNSITSIVDKLVESIANVESAEAALNKGKGIVWGLQGLRGLTKEQIEIAIQGRLTFATDTEKDNTYNDIAIEYYGRLQIIKDDLLKKEGESLAKAEFDIRTTEFNDDKVCWFKMLDYARAVAYLTPTNNLPNEFITLLNQGPDRSVAVEAYKEKTTTLFNDWKKSVFFDSDTVKGIITSAAEYLFEKKIGTITSEISKDQHDQILTELLNIEKQPSSFNMFSYKDYIVTNDLFENLKSEYESLNDEDRQLPVSFEDPKRYDFSGKFKEAYKLLLEEKKQQAIDSKTKAINDFNTRVSKITLELKALDTTSEKLKVLQDLTTEITNLPQRENTINNMPGKVAGLSLVDFKDIQGALKAVKDIIKFNKQVDELNTKINGLIAIDPTNVHNLQNNINELDQLIQQFSVLVQNKDDLDNKYKGLIEQNQVPAITNLDNIYTMLSNRFNSVVAKITTKENLNYIKDKADSAAIKEIEKQVDALTKYRSVLSGGSDAAKVLPGKYLHSSYKKITLVTGYTSDKPDRLTMSQMVVANQLAYAKRQGYNYLEYTDNMAKGYEPYWSKIQIINYWLENNKDNEGKKWLIWFDDDMIIMDSSIKVEDLIAKYAPKNSGKSIIVAKDAVAWNGDRGTAINTGILFVKNSQESRDFFSRIWEKRNQKFTYDGYKKTTLGKCPDQACLHEQQAMAELLRENTGQSRCVAVIEQRDPQNNIGINTFIRERYYWSKRSGKIHPSEYITDPQSSIGSFGDFAAQCTGIPVSGTRDKNKQSNEGAYIPLRLQTAEVILKGTTVLTDDDKKNLRNAKKDLTTLPPLLQAIDTACKARDFSKGGKLDQAIDALLKTRTELPHDSIVASSLTELTDVNQALTAAQTRIGNEQAKVAAITKFNADVQDKIKELKEPTTTADRITALATEVTGLAGRKNTINSMPGTVAETLTDLTEVNKAITTAHLRIQENFIKELIQELLPDAVKGEARIKLIKDSLKEFKLNGSLIGLQNIITAHITKYNLDQTYYLAILDQLVKKLRDFLIREQDLLETTKKSAIDAVNIEYRNIKITTVGTEDLTNADSKALEDIQNTIKTIITITAPANVDKEFFDEVVKNELTQTTNVLTLAITKKQAEEALKNSGGAQGIIDRINDLAITEDFINNVKILSEIITDAENKVKTGNVVLSEEEGKILSVAIMNKAIELHKKSLFCYKRQDLSEALAVVQKLKEADFYEDIIRDTILMNKEDRKIFLKTTIALNKINSSYMR